MNYCPYFRSAKRLSIALAITLVSLLATLWPMRAGAVLVSGNFVYGNGAPAKDRQLHLENRATGDMFVAPCNSDGVFTADVPPGLYDLRAERGVILKYRIKVEQEPLNVGRVVEPVPLDVHRLFQRESVGEAIVKSPAPSTANLTGRPLQAMQFGHAAAEQYGAPVGTPVSSSTPSAKGVEAMPYDVEGTPPTNVQPAPQM